MLTMLTIDVHRRLPLPPEIAAAWDRLHARTPSPKFQSGAAWVDAWAAHASGAWRPLVLVARRDDDVCGIVPLMHLDRRRRGVVPYRALRFLGANKSDFCNVLAAPGDTAEVVAGALDRLASGAPRWEELVLDDLVEGNPAVPALRAWLEARGVAHTAECGAYYYMDLARPWDEVWAETSKRFVRKNVNLARNRLDRAGPWDVLADPAWDAERVVEEAAPIHAARQAELGRASMFRDAGGRAFALAVLAHARAAGGLRTYWLRRDGRPVAYMLGFEEVGVFHAWNMAFDPADAYFYPSRVLLAEIAQDCHARGLRELSLMRGEAEYKGKWTRRSRANWRFRIRNRATLYGRAVGLLEGLLARREPAATTAAE
jgi:CelD/BcsL family acetyltransferase involved in cellulose biosynthesis